MKRKIIRYNSPALKRAIRSRAKAKANPELARLSVFRSNKFIYAQLLDQKTGKTLAGVKAKKSEEAGEMIAKKAKEVKVAKVVFDRRGYKYHGRVKSLADAARAGGLKF